VERITEAGSKEHNRRLFIYLFIRHDGMQLGSYGPLEKQIKCLEREKTNNPKVMPSSLMNKCKMQNRKWYCYFKCSRVKSNSLLHDGLPQYCRPLAATGASREGSFVVRTNSHGCARFLLARSGIEEASCR
jgi:hypothetical protein